MKHHLTSLHELKDNIDSNYKSDNPITKLIWDNTHSSKSSKRKFIK